MQEEPKNMGAWTYVQPRLATASQNTRTARSLHGCACDRSSSHGGALTSLAGMSVDLRVHLWPLGAKHNTIQSKLRCRKRP